MQRVTWTDERLEVNREFVNVRGEMREGFAELRTEINGLRVLMLRLFGGTVFAIVASSFLHGL